MTLRDIGIFLMAALPPVGKQPDPHTHSKSLRAAIKRLDSEATALTNAARGTREIHDTLQRIVRHMR